MGQGHLFAAVLPLADQADLVEALRKTIISLSNPAEIREIRLFGSAARQEMTTASDLDVVVIVESPSEVKGAQKALNQLSRLLDWPVDCLVVSRELFEARARVGGVYAIAKEEGVALSLSRPEGAGSRGS